MADKASNLLEYLKTKTFYRHLALALGLLAVLVFISLQFLKSFTDHGQAIEVPSFTGLKMDKAESLAAKNMLRVQVIDSVFVDGQEPGVVLEQTPGEKFKVKENRTVYLTVNATVPPQIKMPNLKDVSLRQATSLLEAYGLKLGSITYVPDFARNAVLEMKYKGRTIQAGTGVPRGSSIQLVLGKGMEEGEVEVPYMVGLTRKEALERLNLAALVVGAEVFETKVQDSSKVFVYRQSPVFEKDKMLPTGSPVDLYYTSDKEKIKELQKEENDQAAENDE